MRRDVTARCDVIVVGGGPAGATAAAAAVRRGCEVILVERHATGPAKICGEYLCPGGVALLEAQGFGTVLRAMHAAPLLGMRLFAPSGREVRTSFAEGRAGLSVNRPEFDARLVAASGASTWTGRRVVRLARDSSAAQVTLADGTVLEGSVVVGADGRNSVIAGQCGLHASASRGRATIHAYFADVSGCESMGEMHMPGDGTYVGLNPQATGLVNVTYVCGLEQLRPGELGAQLRAAIASMPSLAGRFAGACMAGRARALAPLEVTAHRPHDHRVLLAGDAAGFSDPLTGEGMYGAILSGQLAGAWAARAASTGRTERRDLAGYARARRRALGAKPTLNRSFQWLLKRRRTLDYIGRRLASRPSLGDTLIRVIGNTCPPATLLRPRNLLGMLLP